MFRQLLLLGLAGQALTASIPQSSKADSLTVQTSSGVVTGTIEKTYPNVRQFLGIPYAQAPVGDLRWEAPSCLSKNASKQELQATKLPPSCPQYLSTLGNTIFLHDVLQYNLQGLNKTGATSEDCLKLSVWAPNNKPQETLPVLVFIYGGYYMTGGMDVPYLTPTQLVQRMQDHIVVTFNYRLNMFGFPNAPGLNDQNLGLLDQRLAVEWVQKNIKAFGGDPDRLTLWGQSAGAQSVDLYNYAFYKDPIVSGLIMDSGTALLPILNKDFGQTSFKYVAEHFNCKNSDSAKQLACMRKVPAKNIETFLQQHADSGASPSLSFAPIPDNKIVFSNYTARAEAGQQSKVPAIIGTNAQEGVILPAYPISDPNAGVNQTVAYQATLEAFFCPATVTTQLRQGTGRDTFRYYYAGNFSNIAPRGWEGAYHSSEQPLIFGTYGNYRGPGTELEKETSIAMQEAWVAFAKGGVTGLEATGWEAYKFNQNTMREFGAGVPVKSISVASMEASCKSIAS